MRKLGEKNFIVFKDRINKRKINKRIQTQGCKWKRSSIKALEITMDCEQSRS
jgi:hypothetical protein